jgi:hypothetical protein
MQIIDAVYEKDPNGATLAFADMMKKQIVMPAHLMDDGEHHAKTGRNLFAVSSCLHQQQAAAVAGGLSSRPHQLAGRQWHLAAKPGQFAFCYARAALVGALVPCRKALWLLSVFCFSLDLTVVSGCFLLVPWSLQDVSSVVEASGTVHVLQSMC